MILCLSRDSLWVDGVVIGSVIVFLQIMSGFGFTDCYSVSKFVTFGVGVVVSMGSGVRQCKKTNGCNWLELQRLSHESDLAMSVVDRVSVEGMGLGGFEEACVWKKSSWLCSLLVCFLAPVHSLVRNATRND